jgi:all-trans-retinol 13,14-reductase
LGLGNRLEKEPFDPDGFDTVRFRQPEFEFRFPCGLDRLRERLHETFPLERTAVDEYLQEVERAADSFPFLNLEADGEVPGLFQGPSLQEVLDRLTGDRILKGLLSVHCLLYGATPQEVPFALHAGVVGSYYRSAHGLKGGGRSLAEAFDAELSRRGVDVYCGEAATNILLGADGRPCGVRLAGGRTIACGGCVVTVHPRTLLELAPTGAFRPAYRKRLQMLEETPSAFLFFGGSSVPLTGLQGSNMFFLPSPEAAGCLEDGSEAGPLYLTAARPAQVEAARYGFMAISPVASRVTDRWASSTLGGRCREYGAFKSEIIRKIQDRMEFFCPELKGLIEWSEGATPLTLRDYGHSPVGSLYGIKHRVGQMNPQPLTRVPGLMLAGQAVSAPGIMGAMVSAFLACGHIVGHERIRKEMRACR